MPNIDILDLEEPICNIAREARACQLIADELLLQLKEYGADNKSATKDMRELLGDFAARVARGAAELRTTYYGEEA